MIKRLTIPCVAVVILASVAFYLKNTRPADLPADLTGDEFSRRRVWMIESQIKSRGISDPQVLKALGHVQRHLFVDPEFADRAYEDYPLPIGHGQTISQPYIVAFMTEVLRLGPKDTVLEIGTGSGYQTAILAEIIKKVYTMELIKPLAADAERRLTGMGYRNIVFRSGDGYQGWPEPAQFDAILVTAAPEAVPPALLAQLKNGGRMILPVGTDSQDLFLVVKGESGEVRKEKLFPVRFVPMIKSQDL